MSCLSRCPYFRGVLNEGFHCNTKVNSPQKVVVAVSSRVAQRFADNSSFIHSPVVVTNCSPLIVVVDLQSTFEISVAINELNRVGV